MLSKRALVHFVRVWVFLAYTQQLDFLILSNYAYLTLYNGLSAYLQVVEFTLFYPV